MQLSVIIPLYNEEKYIGPLLDSLLFDDGVEKEIFLTDGGSTDATIPTIQKYQQQYPNIHLVHNEKKYVSFGFNKAFPSVKGKYVTLMGAHALYPPHFFANGLKYLEAGECDVVGGPLLQEGKTDTGKAIAYAMSSKFGVGGTEFRTESKKMFVDSVAFAIYKKEIFEKIGLLDEELVRNQDDELHYRMNAAGYRILMVPEMQCVYYVRNSLPSLYSQYYQYGLYKPLVLKKVRQGIRFRHLVPPMFCLYILSLPLALFTWLWLLPLALYILLMVFIAARATGLSLRQRIIAMAAFPTLHFSYGFGFLRGLIAKP
jgi:succinoglycan biosynthesis protein ExoA